MSATHKVVNGKQVPLTEEERAAIESQWAANAPPPPEEQEARERASEPTLVELLDQAAAASDDIDDFLLIATPTNAQVLAEVRAIDRRQKRIIQALVRVIQRTWRS